MRYKPNVLAQVVDLARGTANLRIAVVCPNEERKRKVLAMLDGVEFDNGSIIDVIVPSDTRPSLSHWVYDEFNSWPKIEEAK